jgi:hypothetical protein
MQVRMAGRAKIPPFARKGRQVLVAAVFARGTREAVFQDTAVQVPVIHLANVEAKKTIWSLETIRIELIET